MNITNSFRLFLLVFFYGIFPLKADCNSLEHEYLGWDIFQDSVYLPQTLLELWTDEQLEPHTDDRRITRSGSTVANPPEDSQLPELLPELDNSLLHSVRRVKITDGRKLLALTFDLCEKANEVTGFDSDVVSVLRSQHIAASFFAGGKWLRTHENKALQLMATPFFEIGNHAWTHANLRVLTGQKMLDQIIFTQTEYQRIWNILKSRAQTPELQQQMQQIPSQPQLMRFPYGVCSQESLNAVNELGLIAVQWDVVSGDPDRGLSVKDMVSKVSASVHPGSIVVFHANGRGWKTAKALPEIISNLKQKGFEFVTVSQLLQHGEPETTHECYELRPGDNHRYDALFSH
jgi:peptidoglycan/xylan/chitin deacetylase (PgdA/CDA1 family)